MRQSWFHNARIVARELRSENLPRPDLKVFKKKNPEVPALSNYHNKASDAHFDLWPQIEIPKEPSSRVNVDILEKIVKASGFKNKYIIETVLHDLKFGAPLMTEGPGRSITH